MNSSFKDCGEKVNCELYGNNSSKLSNDNDLCDNSTYDIDMEFYDDLECFIVDYDEDSAE